MTDLCNRLKSLIRDVPDFPKPGILFKDITPVLADAPAFNRTIAAIEAYVKGRGAALVAGIESRGFIFGAAAAQKAGVGFIPVRKHGKLPWKTVRQSYDLEYGADAVEIHRDAVGKGQRVVIVDDLLATGGTLAGACKLVEKVGGIVAGTFCVIELGFLQGRKKIRKHDFSALVRY
jgi:adenine phosphoribosyltransferase